MIARAVQNENYGKCVNVISKTEDGETLQLAGAHFSHGRPSSICQARRGGGIRSAYFVRNLHIKRIFISLSKDSPCPDGGSCLGEEPQPKRGWTQYHLAPSNGRPPRDVRWHLGASTRTQADGPDSDVLGVDRLLEVNGRQMDVTKGQLQGLRPR